MQQQNAHHEEDTFLSSVEEGRGGGEGPDFTGRKERLKPTAQKRSLTVDALTETVRRFEFARQCTDFDFPPHEGIWRESPTQITRFLRLGGILSTVEIGIRFFF